MVISNTKAKSVYEANGERREWELGFDFDSNVSKLNIILEDAEGYQTVVESNYIVEDNILTYPTLESELDPIAEGYKIILFRSTPQTQETDLRDNVVEKGLDKLTLQVQELSEDLARAVKAPLAEEGVKEYQDLVLKVREERDTALEQIKEATSVVSDYTQASSASANIAKEEADRSVEASNISVMASADAEASAIEAANLANEAKDAVSAYVNGLGAMRNAVIDLGVFEDNQRRASSCIIDFDFEPLDVFIRFTDSSKNMWINGAHSFAGIEKVGYRKYKIFYSISSEDFASQSTIKGPFYVQYVIKYSVFSGKPVMYRGRVDTVDQLPENAEDGDLWYVGPVEQSNKEEYIWQNGKWELLGSTDFTNIYTKEEIDNKVKVIEADIDANADAIQQTRSDFMEADSELQQQINAHAEELTAQSTAIAGKQDVLTAGPGVTIEGNVISATGGGGSAEIPDNVYTSDNLIAGKNVTFTEVPPEGGIDEHTLACWHFDEDSIDVVKGIKNTAVSYRVTKAKFGNVGYTSSLEFNTSEIFVPASGEWTIDFWYLPESGTVMRFGFGATQYVQINNSEIYFRATGKSVAFQSTLSASEWVHCAAQYKSGLASVYVNGKLVATDEYSYTGGNFYFWSYGYLDELRVSNIARYTEDFTPPTEPYKVAEGPSKTAVNAIVAVPTKTSELENDSGFLTGLPDGVFSKDTLLGGKDIEIIPEPVEGAEDSNTKALWHFDSKNTDEVNGLALENIGISGNDPYDTSRMKFGTACTYDFYSSSLKTNDISSLNLTDTDWTLDLWFYQTNYQSSGFGKYGIQTTSKNFLGFKIYRYEIQLEGNMWGSSAGTKVATSTQNTWIHAALQYDHLNNIGSFFIDGQNVYEGAVTDITAGTFKDLYLGHASGPSLLIDELRISNCIRYRENFIPPTEAYRTAKPTGNMVVNFVGEKLQKGADYVVESYNDGANWYRVYKSGWIEQGGSVNTNATITLLKPMKDTNYTVIGVQNGTTAPIAPEGSPRAGVISTTQVYVVGGGSEHNVNYYVCGQGA